MMGAGRGCVPRCDGVNEARQGSGRLGLKTGFARDARRNGDRLLLCGCSCHSRSRSTPRASPSASTAHLEPAVGVASCSTGSAARAPLQRLRLIERRRGLVLLRTLRHVAAGGAALAVQGLWGAGGGGGARGGEETPFCRSGAQEVVLACSVGATCLCCDPAPRPKTSLAPPLLPASRRAEHIPGTRLQPPTRADGRQSVGKVHVGGGAASAAAVAVIALRQVACGASAGERGRERPMRQKHLAVRHTAIWADELAALRLLLACCPTSTTTPRLTAKEIRVWGDDVAAAKVPAVPAVLRAAAAGVAGAARHHTAAATAHDGCCRGLGGDLQRRWAPHVQRSRADRARGSAADRTAAAAAGVTQLRRGRIAAATATSRLRRQAC